MSLCTLCANIPWDTLPEQPKDLARGLSGHDYIQAFYSWPEGMRGHPYHQSLDALRESATSCPLCKLVLKSAEDVKADIVQANKRYEARGDFYGQPTWDMWLIRREPGNDGALVMSFVDNSQTVGRKARENSEAWVVGAIGLCVRDDDPLSSTIKGRPIEQPGGSEIAIKRARNWVQECNQQHANCRDVDMPLPSRIIDVGNDPKSPNVRLWDPVPDDARGKYISLSYCWGKSSQFTTTKSNLDDRRVGIEIAKMPKTMQDIITLARALEIQYVWIDALCIYQDDFENWERESAKMQNIYANAYLTVAASKAKESAEGFLGARPQRDYVQLNYIHGDDTNTTTSKVLGFSLPLREELIVNDYVTLPHEPLSTRAWGVQERVLSRRMLLYGVHQMFFECHEGFRGETGLVLPKRFENIHDGLAPKEYALEEELKDLSVSKTKDEDKKEEEVVEDKKSKAKKPKDKKTEAYQRWYSLLWLYGPKKLSNPSDKLPAISGLAKIYATHIGGQYLAGLWRDRLLEGLAWQSLKWQRVTDYRAPSWSWASGDGIPATGSRKFTGIAEVLDAHVTLKGSNPFGEVTDGWIRLRAPMEQLFMKLDEWDSKEAGQPAYESTLIKMRTEQGSQEGEYSRFDFAFAEDGAKELANGIVDGLRDKEIFALVLLKLAPYRYGKDEDEDEDEDEEVEQGEEGKEKENKEEKEEEGDGENEGTYYSLIVKKVDGTEDRYERLGFLLSDKDLFGAKVEDGGVDVREVVLV